MNYQCNKCKKETVKRKSIGKKNAKGNPLYEYRCQWCGHTKIDKAKWAQ